MRILHFSDFHLDNDGITQSRYLMDRMMDVVGRLHSEKPFDLVIFSGDMIDKGGKSFKSPEEGYARFREIVIARICEDLNIDETRFVAVPGNHEVNREMIVRQYDIDLEESLTTSNAILLHLSDSRKNHGFEERLKDYDTYYRQPWIANITQSTPYHNTVKLADHIVIEADGRRIGLSLLNSAWRAGIKIIHKNQFVEKLHASLDKLKAVFGNAKHERPAENRVLIGPAQINDAISFFKENDVQFRFAVAHHHYSLLGVPDISDSEMCIRRNYNMCFWGHTHISDAEKSEKHTGTIISAVAPGLIRGNVLDNTYINGFGVWDLDFSRGIAYEQAWLQDKDSFFRKKRSDEWHFSDREWIVDFEEYRKEAAVHHIHEIPVKADYVYNELVNNPQGAIILYGLSGIGKTHLLRNIFDINADKTKDQYKRVFYCAITETIFKELNESIDDFFREHRRNDICLICDNTNISAFNEIKRIRDSHKSDVRIIGVINSLKPMEKALSGIPVVELTLHDVEAAVNGYIDSMVADLQKRDRIKRFSDGFPSVAIKLVEASLRDENFNLSTVHNTLSRLYGQLVGEVEGNEDLFELLQALALFQPFPKLDNDSMDLWKCSSLSRLHDKSKSEILQLIDKAKRIWNGEMIEDSSSGFTVRPFSLAVKLADLWLTKHGPDGFSMLLEDISNMPPELQKTVITCLQQRIAGMNLSPGAKQTFDRLASENGVFRSENVVLSALGSQLILAASNVNPTAIAKAIRCILESKTPEETAQINYFARRNLVFALSKLMFYADSFKDAMTSLAMLASVETETSISNNSQGVFKQVFHVLLSGTSVSLRDRLNWLTEASTNQRIAHLLPMAIKAGFAWGSFIRMGEIGAQNDNCKDYQPSDNEIEAYWTGLTHLAIDDFNKNNNIDYYSHIVENNIQAWVDSDVTEWVFPFIKTIAENSRFSFKMLDYDFQDLLHSINRRNPTLGCEFEKLKSLIVPESFMASLQSRQKEFYMDAKDDQPEKEISFFKPLAEEFIGQRVYRDHDTVGEILRRTDFHSWEFCAAISESIVDQDLSDLYDSILNHQAIQADLVSPFLMTLCSMTRNREATKVLIESIYGKKLDSLYIRLMARTEDEALTNLSILKKKYGASSGDAAYLSLYLHHVSLTRQSQESLLAYLDEHFDEDRDAIMEYLTIHYCYPPLSVSDLERLKSIIYRYEPHLKLPFRMGDLMRLTRHILEYEKDDSFASFVCEYFITFPESLYDDYAYSELYGYLISEYQDLLLDSLVERMAEASFWSVPYRLSQSLGSGYGFSRGKLFLVEEGVLKDTIEKHGIKAAMMAARTCPIFEGSESFSFWVTFLLDSYGKEKDVRDCLSQNMGTFSWSGSMIPLLDKKIKCFEKIANHPIPEVRMWVNLNIKNLRDERTSEESREDFLDKLYR